MQTVPFNFNAGKNLEILSKTAFLTTYRMGKTNVMVTAWGALGVMWKLPIFVALVRKSRYSHDLIEKTHEFSVTFPYADMSKAAEIFGHHSGRDMNKLEKCGLATRPARRIETPVLDVPGMHLECNVIYARPMNAEKLDPAIQELWYDRQSNDYHTFFVSHILDSYITP
ncbi:MAG: flavin reductase family protein [Elusimicrobiaceae bacterium]|nr:flavin reductase family protein [Elusimicrobiaceae bacterium]